MSSISGRFDELLTRRAGLGPFVDSCLGFNGRTLVLSFGEGDAQYDESVVTTNLQSNGSPGTTGMIATSTRPSNPIADALQGGNRHHVPQLQKHMEDSIPLNKLGSTSLSPEGRCPVRAQRCRLVFQATHTQTLSLNVNGYSEFRDNKLLISAI
jgi:hypothetical protein